MFNAIARPFGMLLMFLYELVNNYAVALFLIAVAVKIILLPFQMKSKRGMMRQTRLQPKIAELQKKHGANKQKLNEEMAKLYKDEGVNPASGCLWSFIQMPIMIALFYAIRQPLTLMMGVKEELFSEEGGLIYDTLIKIGAYTKEALDEILTGFYAQVNITQTISERWPAFKDLGIEGLHFISFRLGALNFAEIPDWTFFWSTNWNDSGIWLPGFLLFLLPLVSGGAQFISAGIMRKMSSAPEAAGAAGSILKFMPLMSVWFGFILPAALSFYWTIGTVLQIGQDIWLTKKYTKILDEEDAERAELRKAREAELEAKREETERKKAEGLAERDRNTSKRKKQKSDKREQQEKAAEWERSRTPADERDEKHEPGRIGNRRYARGRAYDPDRYAGKHRENDDSESEVQDSAPVVEIESDEVDVYETSEMTDDLISNFEDEDSYIDDDDDDDDDYDDDDDDDDDYDDDDDDDDDDESEESTTVRFDTTRFDSDNK